jgi:hypothetical protein
MLRDNVTNGARPYNVRGDKIATEDADDLIDTANKIIVGLQNGCY